MALLVGFATPVVLLVSFIPMALTSVAFLYLNRRDPDCGTTFSWVTRAMGPIPGFVAGWVIAATGIIVIGSLSETAVTYGWLMFGMDRAMRAIDAYATDDVDHKTPIYLAFGIKPPEVQGEEFDVVTTALAQLGDQTFTAVIKRLKAMGFTSIYRFYVDADSERSVQDVAERLNASAIWSAERSADA